MSDPQFSFLILELLLMEGILKILSSLFFLTPHPCSQTKRDNFLLLVWPEKLRIKDKCCLARRTVLSDSNILTMPQAQIYPNNMWEKLAYYLFTEGN